MKTVVKFSRIRCTSGGSIVRTVSKRIVEPFLAQYPILKNPDQTSSILHSSSDQENGLWNKYRMMICKVTSVVSSVRKITKMTPSKFSSNHFSFFIAIPP